MQIPKSGTAWYQAAWYQAAAWSIRHLPDQNQAAAWSIRLLSDQNQAAAWSIRHMPDQNQAAAWLIRRHNSKSGTAWYQAAWYQAAAWSIKIRRQPDWSGCCLIKIMQLPDRSWPQFVRSLLINISHQMCHPNVSLKCLEGRHFVTYRHFCIPFLQYTLHAILCNTVQYNIQVILSNMLYSQHSPINLQSNILQYTSGNTIQYTFLVILSNIPFW